MKQFTMQQLVKLALRGLERNGAGKSYLNNYRYTGFAAYVKYCEKNDTDVCSDGIFDIVIHQTQSLCENGGISVGALNIIRRSGRILKRLRDSPSPNDLRTWMPKPLHIPPTKKELADPDNIYGLAWRVKQEMKKFGFTQVTLKSYQGQGFYPILKAYHSAGITEYSEIFTADFVEQNRQSYERGEQYRINCQVVRKVACMLREYHSTGTLVWKTLPNYYTKELFGVYTVLISEFAQYLSKMGHLKPSTQTQILRECREFLLMLEDKGMNSITDLNRRTVSEQITIIAENCDGGLGSVLYCLRVFFQYLYDFGETPINLCEVIPDHIPRRKKLREGFSEAELGRLLSSTDVTTPTGKRDYAVILLAAKTGLRACDVAILKRSDIDWRNKEIRIVQQKTGVPLALPLPIDAGNAVAEYILEARPKNDVPNVFLASNAPFRALSSKSLTSIVARAMGRAGIVDVPNKGRRFHSLRRYFGRQLLEAGTSLDMLGEMLGQTNVNAAKPYVATYENDLKACALGLIALRGAAE